jgi:quercetin dioxygenase-like cupin family protein
MKRVLFSAVAVAALMGASVTRAQDPVKVDPKHYTVVFENDSVRVLRIYYAVGEKSVMHSHPDSVAVFLADQKAKMTHPDGKSEETSGKKGEAIFTPAGAHLPENIGTGPIDLILVELKKPAAKQVTASNR